MSFYICKLCFVILNEVKNLKKRDERDPSIASLCQDDK